MCRVGLVILRMVVSLCNVSDITEHDKRRPGLPNINRLSDKEYDNSSIEQ